MKFQQQKVKNDPTAMSEAQADRRQSNKEGGCVDEESKRVIDNGIFNTVLDAVNVVMQRKQLLNRAEYRDPATDEQTYKIEKSDIREVFKEVGIVKQFAIPRSKSSLSLTTAHSSQSKQSFED